MLFQCVVGYSLILEEACHAEVALSTRMGPCANTCLSVCLVFAGPELSTQCLLSPRAFHKSVCHAPAWQRDSGGRKENAVDKSHVFICRPSGKIGATCGSSGHHLHKNYCYRVAPVCVGVVHDMSLCTHCCASAGGDLGGQGVGGRGEACAQGGRGGSLGLQLEWAGFHHGRDALA